MLPQLPDRAAAILPSAVRVGPSLEVLQYINLLTRPYFRPKFA
jgi:hypothetical protein